LELYILIACLMCVFIIAVVVGGGRTSSFSANESFEHLLSSWQCLQDAQLLSLS